MSRGKWKEQRDKRDGQQFLALPMVVLESPAYRAASHTARSLLLDIAMQYTGKNNGRLTACAKYLQPKGWRSNDTIVRARRELVRLDLLVETRWGARPNKAAWYALAWLALDVTDGLDINPKLYRTGGYRSLELHGASLAPSDGVAVTAIAPSHGVGAMPLAPSRGAIQPAKTSPPAPSHGTYLEIPSAPPVSRAAGIPSIKAPRTPRTAGAPDKAKVMQ